jgi:lysophospholipase L1-like esterase
MMLAAQLGEGMHRALPVLVLAGCLAAATVTACSPAKRSALHDHRKPPVSYYLALGDSLSRGVEPNATGTSVMTQHGYADQLYTMLRHDEPGLRLVKLGCPSETTATMISGGICHYRSGAQLTAAMKFLRDHPGRVSLVTLDIGANDPESCLTDPAPSSFASCVGRVVPKATANLTKIVSGLRAVYPHGRMIAMNYYLPALAQWRNGLAGQAVARLIALAAQGYNNLLTKIYQTYNVRIANVFGAFDTTNFGGQVTVPGYGALPTNVAAICRWTWECAGPPRGPNQHANAAGYAVIARTFLLADPARRARARAQAAG